MNISKFFIERPIFVIVLSIVIFLAGLISIPLYLAFKYLFERFMHDFIAAVITNFTRG